MRRVVLVVVIAACGGARPVPVSAPVENTSAPAEVARPSAGSRHWGWTSDDRQYLFDLLDELRRIGEQRQSVEVVYLADRTEKLVADADERDFSQDIVRLRYASILLELTGPVGNTVWSMLDDLREILCRRALQRDSVDDDSGQ